MKYDIQMIMDTTFCERDDMQTRNESKPKLSSIPQRWVVLGCAWFARTHTHTNLNNLFTLSSNSVTHYLPSVEDILEHILARRSGELVWRADSENTFRDVSLVIDNGLLQRAGVIIDNKQIRKVLTFPGNKVFYEFTVTLWTRDNRLEEGERRRSALYVTPAPLYVLWVQEQSNEKQFHSNGEGWCVAWRVVRAFTRDCTVWKYEHQHSGKKGPFSGCCKLVLTSIFGRVCVCYSKPRANIKCCASQACWNSGAFLLTN